MKTKIISTMWLKTCKVSILKKMILAWSTIFRSNFSHWTIDWHRNALLNAKKAWKELWINVELIIDTKWPEIRTWEIKGKIKIKKWNILVLCQPGTPVKISSWYVEMPISYADLYKCKNLNEWSLIPIDSWKINLEVIKIENKKIYTSVLNAWVLTSRRHINVPWVRIDLPILLDSDKEALKLWVEIWAEFVALSFVRDKKDILIVKKVLWEKWKKMKIISKIEHSEALKNIDEIIALSDELMVARGDLWVEIPFYEVPVVQQQLLKKMKKAWKPTIIATQMLISMTKNTIPTRAEVMDVAMAVGFGANKIMLSDETASWKYPVLAIDSMRKIADFTEKNWVCLKL